MPQVKKQSGGVHVRTDKFSKANLILYACGLVPVTWIALLVAPWMKDGLPGLLANFGTAMNDPFHIVWCEDSVRTVLIFLLIYGIAIGIYLSNDRNYRRREEHGSAKWGSPTAINKKYANKVVTENN